MDATHKRLDTSIKKLLTQEIIIPPNITSNLTKILQFSELIMFWVFQNLV